MAIPKDKKTDDERLAVRPAPSSGGLARHVEQTGENPAAVYLARLSSPASRRTMRAALDRAVAILSGHACQVHPGGRGLASRAAREAALQAGARCASETFPWSDLRYQHTAYLRSELASQVAPATGNKILSAVRGVLESAWRLGQLDAETFHRAADVARVSGTTLVAGRAVSRGELAALFAACDDLTLAGARDAALVALGYGGGLRRAEIVALELADYDRETGSLTIRSGKGRRARQTFLPPGATAALEAWIARRGDDPGPLIAPVDKAGRVQLRRASHQTVFDALRSRCAKAGIAACSPHDLRRSFISDMLGSPHKTEIIVR